MARCESLSCNPARILVFSVKGRSRTQNDLSLLRGCKRITGYLAKLALFGRRSPVWDSSILARVPRAVVSNLGCLI